MVQWLRALATLFTGPKFGSQHTHRNSQSSGTVVPVDPVLSSAIAEHEAYTWWTCIEAVNGHICNKIIKSLRVVKMAQRLSSYQNSHQVSSAPRHLTPSFGPGKDLYSYISRHAHTHRHICI